MRVFRYLVALLALLAPAVPAFAQTTAQNVQPGFLSLTCPGGQKGPCFIPYSGTNPLPISGTFSASLAGFRPAAFGTPVSATTSNSTQTLPAGAQVVATNTSTTTGAYCALGATATTSSQFIPPSSWFGFAISGDTQISCITASGTATINTAGGTGLPTGAGGGGGSGGGGGGAVTVADGADVTQGANADAVVAAGAAGTMSAKTRRLTTDLGAAAASVASIDTKTPASPATAGNQTTANTSLASIVTNTTGAATAANQTTANTALSAIQTALGQPTPAGTNILGKVGIDQTTPGTTNGVQVNAAIPAGTNTLGGTFPVATTTGGATPYSVLSAASTNSTSVKGSAGQVYNIAAINTTATLYYLKLYDKATAPTCGTDTPVLRLPVPASTTGAGLTIPINVGAAFASGIGFCLTGALADNDTTSAATGVAINIAYK